jgi:hypothetical protein
MKVESEMGKVFTFCIIKINEPLSYIEEKIFTTKKKRAQRRKLFLEKNPL